MSRYFCTDYQAIDWLMTKYGVGFDFMVDDEQMTTAEDIAWSLREEVVRAYVQPDGMAVLEGLPEKTKDALKELGMWPEADGPETEPPAVVTA